MTSRSIARWYTRTAVALSFVLIATFFTTTQTVVAQSTLQYVNYTNLFRGTDPNPSLTLYSLFKPNTTTPEVSFNLQMSFSGISSTDSGPTKTAAWAQITDFDDSNYVFVLRICDVADTTKTNCLFSTIPHKDVPANASSTDLSSIFSAIFGTLSGTGATPSVPTNLPPSTTQPTGSIFHYQYTSVLSADMQNNKFNVLFPVTSLFGINPTTGGILSNNVTDFVRIGDPRTFQADAWYCAQGSNLPTQNNSSNPNYNMFGGLCGGNRPYFKIATSATFRMPQSAAEAQSQTPGTIAPVDTAPTESNIPGCGLLSSGGSVMGCVAQIAYYLIYRPIAWFAGLMGNLFDFFLGYSLSDESYRAAFAVRGWEIVRDICNIFFIIILVYVGLATVFNTSSFSPKKVLSTLIINALLINFSLFVTRVAIDVSNVVARVFYNSIEVCSGPCVDENSDGTPENLKPGISGYTPLSEKIVSSFNPQKIFDMKVLSAATALPDNGTTAASGPARLLTTDDNEYAGYYLVVSLIASMILFAIAMMFWKTAFFFLGRVIGLYMAMIFAPFAFLSYGNVPLVNKIKKLSWQNWSSDLVKYATLAPIFVFFLYVIYSFLDTDFMKFGQVTGATSAQSFFETVVYIAIPMLIVYYMVNQGVKLAEEYAGDFGKQVQAGAMKVLGAGVGVATGGAAFAGRNVVGRGLRMFGNSGKRTTIGADGKEITTTRSERWAANSTNSWLGRQWNNTYSKSQTGTWDARNVGVKIGGKEYKAGNTLFKGLGLSDSVSKTIGLGEEKLLGKDGKPGGIIAANKKRAENRQKELESRIDMSHLTDDEAKNAAAAYKDAQIKKHGQQHWEDHIDKVEELKAPKAAMDAAKEALDTAKSDLEAKTAAGTATSADRLAVTRAERDFDAKKQTFDSAKMAIVTNVKEGRADSIKDKAAGFAEEKKKKDLAEYKVKDATSFANMMRAEYVNDLQNKSFMRKVLEGVNFSSGLAGIAGAVIAGALPMLAPAIIAAMTGAVAMNFTDGVIDSATGSNAKAIKAINKKAKSKAGTGNVLIDMEARLESLKAIVEKATGKPYDKASEDDILDHMADLQGDVEDLNEKIKDRTRTDDQRKQDRRDRARKLDDLEKLKNIQDKIARQQKDIDDHKQKEKEKEENKKKGEDKDKSK